MTRLTHSTRRRVLEATAGGALLGLAGCLGAPASASSQGGSEDDGHDDHSHGTTGHSEPNHHDEATDGHEESAHGDEHEHSPTEHESGHGHAHDGAVPEPADEVTYAMTTTDAGQHFEPHVLRLNVGGTATWVNESGTHSATAYHPDNDRPLLMPEAGDPFDSGILSEEGAEFEATFDTEGVYHFFCRPHESVGMLGSLIVGEPDPHGQPALEEVPEELPEATRTKLEHLNEKVNEALGHEH
ncbi:MAG: plastocyanin/azurin family copper-binding protein [Halobacteriales archaeon]